jgi:hypothetical protein
MSVLRLDFARLEAYLTQRLHSANLREVAALKSAEARSYDSYLSYCSIVEQQPLGLEAWRFQQARLFGGPTSGARWKDLRETDS